MTELSKWLGTVPGLLHARCCSGRTGRLVWRPPRRAACLLPGFLMQAFFDPFSDHRLIAALALRLSHNFQSLNHLTGQTYRVGDVFITSGCHGLVPLERSRWLLLALDLHTRCHGLAPWRLTLLSLGGDEQRKAREPSPGKLVTS